MSSEKIGQRIRAARKRKGMMLKDVAAKLPGISVARLSNWEQGLANPPNDEVVRLAKLFDVSPGWLATFNDSEPDPEEYQLLKLYRRLDDRGKLTVLRTAKIESDVTAV